MESAAHPLVLEMATREDVPAMTEVWFAAFSQPIIKELFPDTPGMHEWNRQWHIGNIQRSNFKYVRILDLESKDGQGRHRLVAFAAWDVAMPEERGRRFPPWHADSPRERCDALIDQLEKERWRVMGNEKHYCKK